MKKAAIIFLVLIYTFSVIGVSVKADYCCNNLKSLKLVLADGAKDKEGCCKVKYQSFKINDVHSASDILVAPALHFTHVQNINYFFQTHFVSENKLQANNIHGPPLLSNIPIYLSNCILRI